MSAESWGEHGYLALMHEIVRWGEDKTNRTGISTRAVFARQLKFDLRKGFPLLTTKTMSLKPVAAELKGFLTASDSASNFRAFGTKIWDQNANEEKNWLANPARRGQDDLGRIYGVQWRKWRSYKMLESLEYMNNGPRFQQLWQLGYRVLAKDADAPKAVVTGRPDGGHVIMYKEVDQMADLLHKLRHQRDDRRMIVSAWNPADLDEVSLPPCHMIFQCFVSGNQFLDMAMAQRSCDMFLGVPFNIASYALLCHVLADLAGLTPRFLTMSLWDAHIYHNHMGVVAQQLERVPLAPPTLKPLGLTSLSSLEDFVPETVVVDNYQSLGQLSAPMAV